MGPNVSNANRQRTSTKPAYAVDTTKMAFEAAKNSKIFLFFFFQKCLVLSEFNSRLQSSTHRLVTAAKEEAQTTQRREKPRPDKTREEDLKKLKSKPPQDEKENEEEMDTERTHRSKASRQVGSRETRSSYHHFEESRRKKA